jgi:hypothetical protein
MAAMNASLFHCSKNFPHPEGDQATELLLIHNPGGLTWTGMPRCSEHPASDDIPILNRIEPDIKYVIIPL